jgi:hypothetical protein
MVINSRIISGRPGMVAHACNPSYLGGRGKKNQGKIMRSYLKNN